MLFTESQIEALVIADDLPARLTTAIAGGRRGEHARPDLAPQLAYGRHAGPAPHTARGAAVLLLLFRRDDSPGGGRWHLPLTERPLTLAHHAGQISLPGGAIDAGESSQAAAIRELREEVGVGDIKGEVQIIGRLADCYVFASDFLITPWLAFTTASPQWQPHVHEVSNVLEMPLDVLFDTGSVSRLTIERGPLMFHAPCIRVGSARVWGATSMILGELAAVLQGLME